MNQKRYLLAAIVSMVFSISAFSQPPGFTYSVDMVMNQTTINNYDTIYNVSSIIDLQDTANISKIHLKMGTSDGASDLVNHSFLFDVMGGLPAGLSYYRSQNLVTLGHGQFIAGHYFIEIKIEDTSGNLSPTVKWNSLN